MVKKIRTLKVWKVETTHVYQRDHEERLDKVYEMVLPSIEVRQQSKKRTSRGETDASNKNRPIRQSVK